MTSTTWFIDLDMTLQSPASDDLTDSLMEAVEPLHGTLAIGPGPALGLALAVEASTAWEASQMVRDFLDAEIAPLTGTVVLSSLRVLDGKTRTAENETPTFPPLVSVPDIAELLDVTRQQAGRLSHKPGFPPAALETRLGNLWTTAAVEAWNERTERTVGRPKVAVSANAELRGFVDVNAFPDGSGTLHLEGKRSGKAYTSGKTSSSSKEKAK